MFLMIVLKVPIVAAGWIIWWAVRAEPDPLEEQSQDDGGSKQRPPHPRRPLPRGPRRGPHGDPALPSPPRVRSTVARSRTYDR